jgi:hypothetical protein
MPLPAIMMCGKFCLLHDRFRFINAAGIGHLFAHQHTLVFRQAVQFTMATEDVADADRHRAVQVNRHPRDFTALHQADKQVLQ